VTLVSANKFRVNEKRKKKKSLALANKIFSAPASGAVDLDLTLSKRAFGLLTKLGQLKVNATVTLSGTGGLTNTATRAVVLRAPKPSRR
jgi:hypothetical protein